MRHHHTATKNPIRRPRRRRLGTAVFVLLCLLGCASEPLELGGRLYPDLRKADPPTPFNDDGDTDGFRLACIRHREAIEKHLAADSLPAGRRHTLGVLARATDTLCATADPGVRRRVLADAFDVYRAGEPLSVLVTGYYTPVLRGSTTQSDRFRFPVYGPPADLVMVDLRDFGRDADILRGRVEKGRLRPYPDRHAIATGALAAETPILFVDDRLALFFLHIQGSGIVELDDGRRLRLNYAGGNGRPYASIGRALIEAGRIPREQMSMEAIRSYFEAHPEEMDDYLFANPSYVFFQAAEDGPFGSTGAVVTPGRSIAADAADLPEFGLALLDTEIPVDRNPDGTVRLERFRTIVFHQDAGGAINGPDHVDLYFGEGSEAAFRAGHMKSRGSLYYLVPKTNREGLPVATSR